MAVQSDNIHLENEKVDHTYDAAQIQVLEGLEPVRKRPGMYIGSTGEKGLHHLVYEVVDNAVDEALAGFCDRIDVSLNSDGSVSVQDNGRGIPVDLLVKTGRPALETIMTVLHAGGKFGAGGYKVSGGLHGVGASVVNALSEWCEVEVGRNGKLYRQRYEKGVPVTDVEVVGISEGTGTKVTFKPDSTIFETTRFDFDTLSERFQEMAYLNRGIFLNFVSDSPDEFGTSKHREVVFHYEGGISSFVSYLNENKDVLFPEPVYVEGNKDGVSVEIAIQYNTGYNENVLAFANNINTVDGGTHLTGFRTALTKILNEYGRKMNIIKDGDPNLTGDDVREGLAAVISVKLPEPQFEGQTKTKLGNTEVKPLVESIMADGLNHFLEGTPNVGKLIITKAFEAFKAREAARKARELTRRKSALESSTLPGKLADCSDKNPENCELFIVEGDSAGGSAKQGRDRAFQAILPLRGKILNTERARIDKIYANEEIQNLIIAIGTGVDEGFDQAKLRYHKIVIMTDADVDGAHIRTLLLTFFYRYAKPLVEGGYICIAQPPLYKVEKGKQVYYCYSDRELDALRATLNTDNLSISRFKGLGEMMPVQLWETTMDPENRTLLRVTIEDAAAADRLFTVLMGDKVEPRRQFIQDHALEVKNLDV